MCSIFGAIGTKQINPIDLLKCAISAAADSEHRGKSAIGVAYSNGEVLEVEKHLGVPSDFFANPDFHRIILRSSPQMLAFQSRFPTTGGNSQENTQPHFLKLPGGTICVATNGDIPGYQKKKEELIAQGSIFRTTNDSELLLHVISLAIGNDIQAIPDGIRHMMKTVPGTYSGWLATETAIYLFRDPYGNRPFFFMEIDGFFFFASEDVVLQNILVMLSANGLKTRQVDICQVLPGQIIKVNLHGGVEYFDGVPMSANLKGCGFESVYFSFPGSTQFADYDVTKGNFCYRLIVHDDGLLEYFETGQEYHDARYQLGVQLALEEDDVPKVDCVVASPNSGVPAALGYAHQLGLKYDVALLHNRGASSRGFIVSDSGERTHFTRRKYRVLRGAVARNPRIIVVDDSVVRGDTAKLVIRDMRFYGAQEVHLRSSCPMIKYSCIYGVNMSKESGGLIAADRSLEEVTKMVGADSLKFLSIEGLKLVLGRKGDINNFCLACWDGKYFTV